jgi:protocatechuate 3,4-dioxygenase beta subunit
MSTANTTMPASAIADTSLPTEGRYRFRTILPALYPGRTRHYHVKVQAPERPVLTTQLYFPDEPTNRRDRPESWFQIPFQWRHLLPMTA